MSYPRLAERRSLDEPRAEPAGELRRVFLDDAVVARMYDGTFLAEEVRVELTDRGEARMR